MGPLCSLYALERLLHAVTDPPFLCAILAALLGGSAASTSEPPASPSASSMHRQQPGSAAGGMLQLSAVLQVQLQYSPAAYRSAFLGMLRGSDPQLAAVAVRVLAALLRNRAIGEELLEPLGASVSCTPSPIHLLSAWAQVCKHGSCHGVSHWGPLLLHLHRRPAAAPA